MKTVSILLSVLFVAVVVGHRDGHSRKSHGPCAADIEVFCNSRGLTMNLQCLQSNLHQVSKPCQEFLIATPLMLCASEVESMCSNSSGPHAVPPTAAVTSAENPTMNLRSSHRRDGRKGSQHGQCSLTTVVECLVSHKANLSTVCLNRMGTVPAFQCADESQSVCYNASPLSDCLGNNYDNLSELCQQALDDSETVKEFYGLPEMMYHRFNFWFLLPAALPWLCAATICCCCVRRCRRFRRMRRLGGAGKCCAGNNGCGASSTAAPTAAHLYPAQAAMVLRSADEVPPAHGGATTPHRATAPEATMFKEQEEPLLYGYPEVSAYSSKK